MVGLLVITVIASIQVKSEYLKSSSMVYTELYKSSQQITLSVTNQAGFWEIITVVYEDNL